MLGLFKGSPEKSSGNWLDRLKTGLKNTSSRLGGLLVARKIDEALFDELEAAPLAADTGVQATTELLRQLRDRASRKKLTSADELKAELKELLVGSLSPLQATVDFRRASP